MIEKLLNLDDIMLYPAQNNHGTSRKQKYIYGVLDEIDNTMSLPIFVSPNESVVNKLNWRVWDKEGLRPVLPRTEELDIRLDGCQYIFAAFTIDEVRNSFIRSKRNSRMQFRICIEAEDGSCIDIMNTATELRKIYGPQVNIMAGNIENPKTYIDYCKAGIDYARVGSLCCDPSATGFYYPLASLILDIIGLRGATVGLPKKTKIIADGDVDSISDIVKAIALGADYVMLDRQLASLVEASGPVFKKEKDEEGHETLEEVNQRAVDLSSLGYEELKDLNLRRYFTTGDNRRTDSVRVSKNLQTWLGEMYNLFSYSFSRADALTWEEFKKGINFCRTT